MTLGADATANSGSVIGGHLQEGPLVASQTKTWTRIGWVLTALVGVFMTLDSAIKLVPIPAVAQTLGPLGFPTGVRFERGLGLLGLGCTLLYLAPCTSLLGAICLTGYLGGAIAVQLRVGNPVFSHLLFGAYLGLMAWGGLWLRTPSLRALLPIIVPGRGRASNGRAVR